jgi:hypothetical protein
MPDLPPKFRLAATLCAASGTALLGYFALDNKPPQGPSGRLPILWLTLALVAGAAGCTIAGFRGSAVIPSFGEYSLEITSGSIGRAPTNQPPQGTNTTTP